RTASPPTIQRVPAVQFVTLRLSARRRATFRARVGSRPDAMVAGADGLKGRSFTRVADWSRDELLEVLDLADELKRLQRAGEEHHLLPGRTLGMIFQKPSTPPRVS